MRCVLQEVKLTLEPGAVSNRRELQTASPGIGGGGVIARLTAFRDHLGVETFRENPVKTSL